MKLKAVFKKISLFWNAKKIWSKPKQAQVLIYDRCGAEYLLEYLDSAGVEILDVRQESLNIYIFLKMIYSGRLRWSAYIEQYLKYVNPLVVITFIDNNP